MKRYKVIDSNGRVTVVQGAMLYLSGDAVAVRNESRQTVAVFRKPISVILEGQDEPVR